MIILFANNSCKSQNENKDFEKDKPKTPSVFDFSNMEDSLCHIGMKLALKDLENEILGYYFYGEPGAKTGLYHSIINKHYKIKYKGGGCMVERFGVCYNEVMKNEIEKRYGKSVKEISKEIQPEVDSLYNILGPKGPEYKRGIKARHWDVACNLIIPEIAEQYEEVPFVIVELTIDTFGKAVNPKIEKGFSKIFDDEALKAINYLGEWEPAIYNGIKTEQKVSIPIRFYPRSKHDCD